jgi:hypothetical protein
MSGNNVIELFELTQRITDQQLKDLTHPHSLVQPPFQGNCINWVLGHVLVYRGEAIELLGGKPLLNPDQQKRYRAGSAPVSAAGEDAMSLDDLRSLMSESLKRIRTRLEGISIADLELNTKFGDDVAPLKRHLDFLTWHETYHVGQFELLRQMALKELPTMTAAMGKTA